MGRHLWSFANQLSPEYRQHKREIQQFVSLDPERAAAEARRRLHRYLIYCRTYSAYWREHWPPEAMKFSAEEAEDVLALLPRLSKSELRNFLNELRIAPEARKDGDGYPRLRGQRTLRTGGSTGVPVKIYVDDVYMERNRATCDFFYGLCGLQPGEPFFYIWGSPNELADIKQSRKKQLSSWLRGMHRLPAFGLSPEKIEEIRDELSSHKGVRSAVCFTSVIETVVNYAEREGLSLPKVDRALMGGGLLHKRLRELILKHFAAEVFDTYGSRDFGLMAHETPTHDGLSIAEWFNKVEVLDSKGDHVRPGEKGEIHITAINNFSCALIKVEMGDTARWYPDAGRNPIPTPRLTELTGRTVEHLYGPNGVVIDPSAVIHIVGVVISPPWLRKFQLVQRSLVRYELRTESWDKAITEREIQELQTKLRTELANLIKEQVDVRVVVLNEIPPLRSGKHQYCLKEFDEPQVVSQNSGVG
jgi:phenylacetate-CoA ligase